VEAIDRRGDFCRWGVDMALFGDNDLTDMGIPGD
jgi:hypothetical protein